MYSFFLTSIVYHAFIILFLDHSGKYEIRSEPSIYLTIFVGARMPNVCWIMSISSDLVVFFRLSSWGWYSSFLSLVLRPVSIQGKLRKRIVKEYWILLCFALHVCLEFTKPGNLKKNNLNMYCALYVHCSLQYTYSPKKHVIAQYVSYLKRHINLKIFFFLWEYNTYNTLWYSDYHFIRSCRIHFQKSFWR